MAKVYKRPGENIDQLIDRFSQLVRREGILARFREKSIFYSKKEKTINKSLKAARIRNRSKK
jgi:ribosomal protein S21